MVEASRHETSGTDDLYNVMVVDDSAVIRGILTRILESDPLIGVAESASNGLRAISALEKRDDIDIIVLDIEMPVMDGLTALPKLLESRPGIQVIVASTLTRKNAEISLRCLQAGAADYLTKPGRGSELSNADEFRRELLAKVKALGALSRRSRGKAPIRPKPSIGPVPRSRGPERGATFSRKAGLDETAPIALRKAPLLRPLAIAIGSSTGGPQALHSVFQALRTVSLEQPIFITQHMPATFTSLLAKHIAQSSGRVCVEAAEGQRVRPGEAYIAPGGYHLGIAGTGTAPTIKLSQTPPENFCRPSVDPMVRSLIGVYGKRLLLVMLTGMGSDGLKGARALVEAGGDVIGQDERTSVVWGMPGAVATAGLCSAVLPLSGIGSYIERVAMRSAA
jgi:two-component system chemotaxis response regulator CheB